MNIEEEIFNESKVNYNKLITYGFKKDNGKYYFEKLINNKKFKVIITIDNKGKINGKIYDLKMDEEYLNYRIDSAGSFSNSIKEEYINILKNIKEKCFDYSEKVKSWVIPSNPNLFDIISYFNVYDTIIWHQKINIDINAFVYIYVGKPYSCLLYKCKVIRNNFEGYAPRCMELKLIRKYDPSEYPLDFLKKMGLTSIRFVRSIPEDLSDYLYDK